MAHATSSLSAVLRAAETGRRPDARDALARLVEASATELLPVAETLTVEGVFDVHVTVLPLRTLPLASLRIALNCVPGPPMLIAQLAGLTVTVATAGCVVVPLAMLESAPMVGLPPNVPRNATTWKL